MAECHICGGCGRVDGGRESIRCYECNGSGVVKDYHVCAKCPQLTAQLATLTAERDALATKCAKLETVLEQATRGMEIKCDWPEWSGPVDMIAINTPGGLASICEVEDRPELAAWLRGRE